jgi:hypothetical protein
LPLQNGAHAFGFAMALLKTAMKPAVMLVVVFALFCAGGAAADKADLHRTRKETPLCEAVTEVNNNCTMLSG